MSEADEPWPSAIGGKTTVFKEHCRERMRLRGISEQEVRSVLISRGTEYPGNQGRKHILDTVNGRRIRVTVEETDMYCNIVTVVAPDEED